MDHRQRCTLLPRSRPRGCSREVGLGSPWSSHELTKRMGTRVTAAGNRWAMGGNPLAGQHARYPPLGLPPKISWSQHNRRPTRVGGTGAGRPCCWTPGGGCWGQLRSPPPVWVTARPQETCKTPTKNRSEHTFMKQKSLTKSIASQIRPHAQFWARGSNRANHNQNQGAGPRTLVSRPPQTGIDWSVNAHSCSCAGLHLLRPPHTGGVPPV